MERLPPRNRKKIVEKRCYLLEMYTFGKEAEIPEILVKNYKKSIFHRDFDQKISNYLEILLNCLLFGVTQQNFAGRFLNFLCPMEIIRQKLIIWNFYRNSSRFSPKFLSHFR